MGILWAAKGQLRFSTEETRSMASMVSRRIGAENWCLPQTIAVFRQP